MGINFPNLPTNLDRYQPVPGGYTYQYLSAKSAWVKYAGSALAANKIINPSAQISQQNGSTASGANPADFFIADQWPARISLMNTKSLVFQRTARVSPQGSPFGLSWKWTAVGGTLDANCFAFVIQQIEGTRTADLMWGTANARPAVLRFGLSPSSNAAQTIFVFIRNNDSTYSWVHEVSIPAGKAGTDIEYTVPIPACTVGTWLNDTGIGLMLGFTPVGGSARITPAPDAWAAGNFQRTATTPNPTVNDIIEIFDVGLHVDPANTGVAPPFQVPNIEDAMMECQRYWYKQFSGRGPIGTATFGFLQGVHPVPMRVNPSIAIVGTPVVSDLSVAPVLTSLTNNNVNKTQFYLQGHSAGGYTVGRPAMQYTNNQTTSYLAMNARL